MPISPRSTASNSPIPARAAIDRDKKLVRLANGASVNYDRLVLAPGIDLKFDSVPGYSEAASQQMPHAWKAGPQTQLLKKQLDALKDGALIVMVDAAQSRIAARPDPMSAPR